MRSNKMSTMSELTTLTLVVSKLSTTQMFASGNQTERSYGCQISIADPRQFTENIHQCYTCDMTKIKRLFHDTQKVLTTDEECDVCHPYSHCDHDNDLIHVPNGDSTEVP